MLLLLDDNIMSVVLCDVSLQASVALIGCVSFAIRYIAECLSCCY